MATIRKRGKTYQIRVSCGYSADGRQIEKTMTWQPEAGMTPRQVEKALNAAAVMFEEKCQGGTAICNMKFESFAQLWFKNYAEKSLRPRTLALMHGLEQRTYAERAASFSGVFPFGYLRGVQARGIARVRVVGY